MKGDGGGGILLPIPQTPPQNKPLKNPPRLGIIYRKNSVYGYRKVTKLIYIRKIFKIGFFCHNEQCFSLFLKKVYLNYLNMLCIWKFWKFFIFSSSRFVIFALTAHILIVVFVLLYQRFLVPAISKKICGVTTSFSYLIMYISKGHNLKKWVNFNKNGFCYWVFLNSFWVFVFLMMRGNGSVRAIFSCQVYSVTEVLNRGLKKY